MSSCFTSMDGGRGERRSAVLVEYMDRPTGA